MPQKRALIVGAANTESIAYDCAEALKDGGPFGTVVVQLQMAVFEIWAGLRHPDQCIADGLSQRRLARDLGQVRVQPGLLNIENRLGL